METTIQIQATINWLVQRTPSGAWVGVCDPLGLTVEASDEVELRSVIGEAQHYLFLDLLEDGELDRFLRERGWHATAPIPLTIPEGVRFDVPFNLEPLRAQA